MNMNMKWSVPVEGLFFIIGEARCADLAQFGNYRNSHQICSIKKDILKNLAKFTGKQICQALGLHSIKKRLWYRCFAVNFHNF